MATREDAEKNGAILIGVYSSSMGISMTALTIVAILEVFMLVYSVVNAPMYGDYLWHYRCFYIALLVVALVYIALNAFVKKDVERRYGILNVANPLYALFFFAWALGITFFDAIIWGTVDSMVFMTFSLVVPLSFYLFPLVYLVIVIVADANMMYLVVTVLGSIAPLINLSIFCVFQIVLGFSFLRLRLKLAERIVEERKNADVDILTGFSNRRVYDADMKKIKESPENENLVYVSIDLNLLKETNDDFGHEAGDKLLVGAAECIRQCFGEKGKLYRIGGDEFVALVFADQDELNALFDSFNESTRAWSESNGMKLSAAYGYARHSEYPDDSAAMLARVADERMYASKAHFYQTSGKDRRRHN